MAYQHKETTRQPVLILIAFAAFVGIALVIWRSSPWFVSLPLVVALVLCIWALVLPTVSGCRITAEAIEVHRGNMTKSYALTSVKSYSSHDWSDGPPSISIQMHDGTEYRLPDSCIGDARSFCSELERNGIHAKNAS